MPRFLAIVAAAAVALSGTDAARVQRAAAPTATIHNANNECLVSSGNYVQWDKNCNKAIQFVKPSGTSNVQLKATTGGKCLGVIPQPNDANKFPSLNLYPCKSGDKNQLWTLNYGSGKNQLKSNSDLGVCGGGAGSFVGCPASKSVACVDYDEGYAGMRPCTNKYKAVLVDNKAAAAPAATTAPKPAATTAPKPTGSLSQQFASALSGNKYPTLSSYIGYVLPDHNDITVKFAAGTPVAKMIDDCFKRCQSAKCQSFDVVVNKNLCYISTTGGKSSDTLKPDANAAAFFVRA